jgi:hypothetical protein
MLHFFFFLICAINLIIYINLFSIISTQSFVIFTELFFSFFLYFSQLSASLSCHRTIMVRIKQPIILILFVYFVLVTPLGIRTKTSLDFLMGFISSFRFSRKLVIQSYIHIITLLQIGGQNSMDHFKLQSYLKKLSSSL